MHGHDKAYQDDDKCRFAHVGTDGKNVCQKSFKHNVEAKTTTSSEISKVFFSSVK
jgi:hypothetical protein